jgi:hypothetical protein
MESKSTVSTGTVLWIVFMVLAFAGVWALPMPISIHPFVPSFWGVVGVVFFTWLWASAFAILVGLGMLLVAFVLALIAH